ncbi:head-tail adaptor protein [Jannaschia sp. S6380]|uniref:head-tail adaptor protein n=1 Tax=Jannaschia sp. S6380 TaxID=2926408 RepID=UPI001FF4186A|nr:head-tail adaptor protein [Jannaschia sp. S6380]MCK0166892.1 head-tail adaptor protein [Jannaschia sp. S6380]
MGRVLTRRMTLVVPARAADGGGGFVRDWVVRGAFWASVRMRSGALRHTEFGRTPRLQVRIVTHGLPEGDPMRPEPGDRLRDGMRSYEVQAVHEGARHELVILAGEVPREEQA